MEIPPRYRGVKTGNGVFSACVGRIAERSEAFGCTGAVFHPDLGSFPNMEIRGRYAGDPSKTSVSAACVDRVAIPSEAFGYSGPGVLPDLESFPNMEIRGSYGGVRSGSGPELLVSLHVSVGFGHLLRAVFRIR